MAGISSDCSTREIVIMIVGACVCCVQGYRASNAYIVTQMPLPHTVIDLWRMVHEHKCGTIVMLNPWDEADTVRLSLPAYSPFSQISHSVKR